MPRFQKREEEGYELGLCRVLHITEKAVRVEVLDGEHAGEGADGEDAVWLPKSQIHKTSQLDDTTLVDEELTAVVTAWFAKQKGWQ